MSVRHVELPAGRIRYRDTGEGPPIVFLHGLLVDGALWRKVTPRLEGSFRCLVPDLPLGSHTEPMKSGADLSPRGVARLVGDFLEALDLDDVTLVANDTGGAIAQIFVADRPPRVGRLVLTPSDAFDNFLPPMFRPLQWVARIPGGLTPGLNLLRARRLRRLPLAFGWLSRRPVPDDVSDAWLRPFLTNAGIRRDLARFLRAIDKDETLDAAERLRRFDRPVLLVWTPEDRFFPFEHARRLAELLPDARLEEVIDSYTFIPEDQPERLAELVAEFATAPTRVPA
jgi:pimeloyl-ACP methyl ester carboxylesterase